MTITVIAVVEVTTIIIIMMLNIEMMMMMMMIIRISVYDPSSYWCYLSRSEKGVQSSCLNRIFSSLSNCKDHSLKIHYNPQLGKVNSFINIFYFIYFSYGSFSFALLG